MRPPQNDGRRIRPGSSPSLRRQLRRRETDAERLLWFHIRDRQLGGWKFRRQHSIGPYVLDFYCPDAHLGLELDGSQHAEPKQLEHDETRTRYLRQRGVRLLRFSDRDVLTDPTAVLEFVLAALTLPSPTAVGEGLA